MTFLFWLVKKYNIYNFDFWNALKRAISLSGYQGLQSFVYYESEKNSFSSFSEL